MMQQSSCCKYPYRREDTRSYFRHRQKYRMFQPHTADKWLHSSHCSMFRLHKGHRLLEMLILGSDSLCHEDILYNYLPQFHLQYENMQSDNINIPIGTGATQVTSMCSRLRCISTCCTIGTRCSRNPTP